MHTYIQIYALLSEIQIPQSHPVFYLATLFSLHLSVAWHKNRLHRQPGASVGTSQVSPFLCPWVLGLM